jgi:hypothetical protein
MPKTAFQQLKDEKAFTAKSGICYVPEAGDQAYTHQAIMIIAKQNEALAKVLFDLAEWQHIETIFEELVREEEIDVQGNFVDQDNLEPETDEFWFELAIIKDRGEGTETTFRSNDLKEVKWHWSLIRPWGRYRYFIDLWINGDNYWELTKDGLVKKDLLSNDEKSLDTKLMNDDKITQEMREQIMEQLSENINKHE